VDNCQTPQQQNISWSVQHVWTVKGRSCVVPLLDCNTETQNALTWYMANPMVRHSMPILRCDRWFFCISATITVHLLSSSSSSGSSNVIRYWGLCQNVSVTHKNAIYMADSVHIFSANFATYLQVVACVLTSKTDSACCIVFFAYRNQHSKLLCYSEGQSHFCFCLISFSLLFI
jgi:hypothetical protein